jgi:hypothetical protein
MLVGRVADGARGQQQLHVCQLQQQQQQQPRQAAGLKVDSVIPGAIPGSIQE